MPLKKPKERNLIKLQNTGCFKKKKKKKKKLSLLSVQYQSWSQLSTFMKFQNVEHLITESNETAFGYGQLIINKEKQIMNQVLYKFDYFYIYF